MTHRHILLLDGKRFAMTERAKPPFVELKLEAYDGPVPERTYEHLFNWFTGVTESIVNDGKAIHVLDPQHVLTT